MDQRAEGFLPAMKSGVNHDLWEQRILEQYTNPLHKVAVSCHMEMIRAYDEQIKKLEAVLVRQTKKGLGRDLGLLLSVPGIGPVLAMTILFEADTIDRFPTVKDFLSYCRLVKGSVASAGKFKGLSGGKMGNAYLRWAFGEAAVAAKKCHPLLALYARELLAKHGKFKGNAILATKIARAVYFMLQAGTLFDAERVIATAI
jgi:transposase